MAEKMLNYRLVTKQTKPDGVLVEKVHFNFISKNKNAVFLIQSYLWKKLMIAEALDISRETYFAILLDRAFDGPVMIGSPVGGMDIEEVSLNLKTRS